MSRNYLSDREARWNADDEKKHRYASRQSRANIEMLKKEGKSIQEISDTVNVQWLVVKNLIR